MASLLVAYAYQPQTWLIIGLVFVLLELTDGSTIFFLPLGLGGIVMSLWVYLVNESILPLAFLSPKWYFAVLLWAGFALVISLALTRYRKHKSRRYPSDDGGNDINDY